MKSALVTGGAGFIGSHVIDRLLQEGYRVAVIDNLSAGKKENVSSKAVFYEQDIRDPSLEETFAKEKPEAVFHFAAQASVARSLADPHEDADVNVLGSLRVWREAQKRGVKKFVFASTGGAMYGEEGCLPAKEDDEPRPRSPYAVSKLAVEQYLKILGFLQGIPFVCLRFANVYGPRQDPFGEAGVVAIFASRMARGGQAFVHGNGEQTRDFLYVSDAVQASIAALKPEARGVYHIGTGKETSVNQLFGLVKEQFGSSLTRVHDGAREGEQQRSSLNFSKAKRELAWTPAVSLSEGIEFTSEWFGRHGLREQPGQSPYKQWT